MLKRQRPEKFFVSEFRTNSIEDLKSNPSHTGTKAISHSPTLNNIDVWKKKFHALSHFMYGPFPRVKSECKTLKNLKSSARLRDSYQCNFFFNFNLDEPDCRHVCRLKIHQTLRSQEQVGNPGQLWAIMSS